MKINNFINFDLESSKLLIEPSDIVCSHLYTTYGKNAMKLIDKRLLEFIALMMSSVFLGRYLLINNYKDVDALDISNPLPVSEERGLHCNLCRSNIVSTQNSRVYINRRFLGLGIDFDIYEKTSSGKMKRIPIDEVYEDLEGLITTNDFTTYKLVKYTNHIGLELYPKIEDDKDTYTEDILERFGVLAIPKVYKQYTSDDYLALKDKGGSLRVSDGEYKSYTPDPSVIMKYSILEANEIATYPLEKIGGIAPLMRYRPGASEEQIRHRIRYIATELKCNPNWITAIIAAESGGSPYIWNGTAAVGLIQFTRVACTAIGTTQSKLERMSAYEQLVWVHKYYKNALKGFVPKTPGDLYVATFAPAYLGENVYKAIYSAPAKSYYQNAGLDLDKKGFITAWDLTRRISQKAKEFKITI